MRQVVSLLIAAHWMFCGGAATEPEVRAEKVAAVDLLFLVENSPGMREHIASIRLTAVGPDDRIALMTFEGKARMRENFTKDQRKVAEQIRRAGHPGPSVNPVGRFHGRPDIRLFTSLLDASAAFRALPADANRARLIVVLFGSEDYYPKPTPKEVEAALKDANIRLFAVAVRRYDTTGQRHPNAQTPPTIPGPMPPGKSNHLPLPEMTLKALAEITAGTSGEVFSEKWDLASILERVRRS